jgi:hypothetical protein
MGGVMRYRVNRNWNDPDNANKAPKRFFWELLSFFYDHPNYSIVAYGDLSAPDTGRELGTAWPDGTGGEADWLSWPAPASEPTIPENGWFVIQADLASPVLDGAGSMQWQAKFQYTLSTGFDDPSGVDYNLETDTEIVAVRFSIDGGWNHAAFDFSDVATVPASTNAEAFYEDGINFGVHILGDADTVWWVGAGSGSGLPLEDRTRGGYLGLVRRRSAAISYPCLMMVGRVSQYNEGSGQQNILSRRTTNSNYLFNTIPAYVTWWSYLVGHDDGVIEGADKWLAFTWGSFHQTQPDDHWTDEFLIKSIPLRLHTGPDYYSKYGELRFLGCCNDQHGLWEICGDDGDYMQIASDAATYGGITMPWPAGTLPAWS